MWRDDLRSSYTSVRLDRACMYKRLRYPYYAACTFRALRRQIEDLLKLIALLVATKATEKYIINEDQSGSI